MPTVAEHIARLRAEATVVDSGSFKLDGDAARAKLAQFRYLDRDAYLGPLAEGLIACGASWIEAGHDGADVIVTVRGGSLESPGERLRHLFASPFADVVDDVDFGFSRIAVAIDMALGNRGIEQVIVEWGLGDHTLACVYRPDAPPELLRVNQASSAVRLSFDRGWARELMGVVVDVTEPELSRLAEAARFADLPVEVDGRRVSGERRGITDRYMIEGEGFALQLCVDPALGLSLGRGFQHRAAAIFFSHGMHVGTRTLEVDDPAPGFVAFIDLERPDYDLSQTRLRETDITRAATQAAVRASGLLYDQMVAQAGGR